MTKRSLMAVPFLIFIFIGFFQMYKFALTPGSVGIAQNIWPVRSSLIRNSKGRTAVVFLHSECSCSLATMAELETLHKEFFAATQLRIVFYQPKNRSENLANAQLWQRASALPGAKPVVDRSGEEARLFGAETSGQTYLYDSSGDLIFAGGLTPARSHSGDSRGLVALKSAAASGTEVIKTPTFGCSLRQHQSHLAEASR